MLQPDDLPHPVEELQWLWGGSNHPERTLIDSFQCSMYYIINNQMEIVRSMGKGEGTVLHFMADIHLYRSLLIFLSNKFI